MPCGLEQRYRGELLCEIGVPGAGGRCEGCCAGKHVCATNFVYNV